MPRFPGLPQRATFTSTGRLALHTLESLPVAVGEVGAVMVGRHRWAAEWQRRRTRRFLGASFVGRPAVDRWATVLGHALLSLPLAVLGWLLLLLIVPNGLRNLAYPLFGGDYSDAWGGPTLAGAWAVHAGLALLMLPGWIWLLRALTSLQCRLTGRLLASDRRRATLPLSVVTAAFGVLFLRALIHQL